MTVKDILALIANRWQETTRYTPKDEGNLIGLPHPFTVPCAKGHFQELYYWDTYFASRGLALQGMGEQVKNNCDDFIYEIEKFGFIPNGSRTFYLNRSQPPYFGAMVALTYRLFPNQEWLRRAVAALEKEYAFWTAKRMLPCGLFHYGHHGGEKDAVEIYHGCCVRRLAMPEEAAPEYIQLHGSHTLAEAESGWDFNPRFERRCMDYAPIDLNCLLFHDCMLLADFHRELNNPAAAEKWQLQAEQLKQLINRYCWNAERGAFMDYDSKENKFSPVLSAASLHPLWVGLASAEQAAATVKTVEQHLEFDHGISTCEQYDSGLTYQWDYPNGWPCLQIIAIDAFARYGYHEQAGRLAEKYIGNVIRCYEISGDIWEKYNIVTGTIEVKDEYKMPAMMGWSAGAFVVAADYLDGRKK